MIKPYELTATRLENRGNHPPTRAYVDALVEGVLASGVEACWNSAVSPRGTPFFPSHVFPVHHPEADRDIFRYLIDRLHAIGRPVLSWYPLNLGGGVLAEHPDWAVEFYHMRHRGDPPGILSAMLQLPLRRAAAAVCRGGRGRAWVRRPAVRRLHLGQSWRVPAFSQPGCRCAWCRAHASAPTAGLDLPGTIDPTERRTKVWIKWRYDVLTDVWQRCIRGSCSCQPGGGRLLQQLPQAALRGLGGGDSAAQVRLEHL